MLHSSDPLLKAVIIFQRRSHQSMAYKLLLSFRFRTINYDKNAANVKFIPYTEYGLISVSFTKWKFPRRRLMIFIRSICKCNETVAERNRMPISALALCRHRCKSRQILGGAKDFCPNSPKLAQKKTSNKSDLQKKKKLFMSIRGHFFKSKHVGRHFCSDFHGVCEGS